MTDDLLVAVGVEEHDLSGGDAAVVERPTAHDYVRSRRATTAAHLVHRGCPTVATRYETTGVGPHPSEARSRMSSGVGYRCGRTMPIPPVCRADMRRMGVWGVNGSWS